MSYRPERMKFGVFMAPLHHIDFDEAWLGDHHSGAVEIFASPEITIAAKHGRIVDRSNFRAMRFATNGRPIAPRPLA